MADLDQGRVKAWLREDDPAALERLWAEADAVRRARVGDEVHLRGLIEVSNYCVRLCAYCGLRSPNSAVERYRMTDDEIENFAAELRDRFESGGDRDYPYKHCNRAGLASHKYPPALKLEVACGYGVRISLPACVACANLYGIFTLARR